MLDTLNTASHCTDCFSRFLLCKQRKRFKTGQVSSLSCGFHVVRFLKTKKGRLYSIHAAVVRFECVCCLPAQHVSFVGGRIDVQERTAEYVLGVLEFTWSYREETSSSQAKSTTQVLG